MPDRPDQPDSPRRGERLAGDELPEVELPASRPPPPLPDFPPIPRRPEPAHSALGKPADMRDTMRMLGIGMNFVGMVAGGVILGWVFDYLLGSNPWGVLIGMALGLIGGTTQLAAAVGRTSALAPKARRPLDRT